jgi:calcium/calmodulin-dependent protein kinase (CaM kinase) II
MDPRAEELIALNQHLLDSIAAGDWATYERLCDPALTAFEPEARGHLVEGLDFHRFYFQAPADGAPVPKQNTMSSPRVHLLGDDAAVVAYVRLVQRQAADGSFTTDCCEETRIWRRDAGGWRHVHYHRSCNR